MYASVMIFRQCNDFNCVCNKPVYMHLSVVIVQCFECLQFVSFVVVYLIRCVSHNIPFMCTSYVCVFGCRVFTIQLSIKVSALFSSCYGYFHHHCLGRTCKPFFGKTTQSSLVTPLYILQSSHLICNRYIYKTNDLFCLYIYIYIYIYIYMVQ